MQLTIPTSSIMKISNKNYKKFKFNFYTRNKAKKLSRFFQSAFYFTYALYNRYDDEMTNTYIYIMFTRAPLSCKFYS